MVLGASLFMSDLGDDYEHPVGDLLRRHYAQTVTPDVAARHTMAIHREAARIRLAERRALRTARRPRRAVVASLVGAMVVGSASGAMAASEESVPGQVLYPVKRAGEQARLFAATPLGAQAEVHLMIATHRTEELAAVGLAQPQVVPRLVAEAEAAIHAATREGASQPEVDQVVTSLVAATAQADEASDQIDPSDVAVALPAPSPAVQASPLPSPSVSPSDLALGASEGSALPGASASPSASAPSPSTPETTTVTVPTPSPSPSPSPPVLPLPSVALPEVLPQSED
jgi:hypothetical protein